MDHDAIEWTGGEWIVDTELVEVLAADDDAKLTPLSPREARPAKPTPHSPSMMRTMMPTKAAS
jgi:hypothetical protein